MERIVDDKDDDKEKKNIDEDEYVPLYMRNAISTRMVYEYLVQPLKNFYIEKVLKHTYEKSYVKQIMMIDKIPSMMMDGYKVSEKEDIKDFMILSFIDNRYAYYKIKYILKKEFHVDIDEYESNAKEKWESIRKLLINVKSKTFFKDMVDKIEKTYSDSIRKYKYEEVTEVGRIRLFTIYLHHHNILDELEFSSKYPKDDVIECLKDFLKYFPKYFEVSKEHVDLMMNLKILFNIEEDDLIEY